MTDAAARTGDDPFERVGTPGTPASRPAHPHAAGAWPRALPIDRSVETDSAAGGRRRSTCA